MKHVQSAQQNLNVPEAAEPELAHAEISGVHFSLATRSPNGHWSVARNQ